MKITNCYLHPEREAMANLNVPCAPGGRIAICAECKADAEIAAKVWDKYSSEHSKAIATFKAPANPNN